MIPGTSLLISLKPRLNKPNLGDPTVRIKDFRSTLNPASASCSSWRVVVVPPPRSHIVSRLAVWSRCLSRLYDFHSKSFLGTITMKSVAARASPTSLSEATPDQLNRCARPPSPEVLLSDPEPHLYTFGQQISYLLQSASAFPEDAEWEPSSHRLKSYRPSNEQLSPSPKNSRHASSDSGRRRSVLRRTACDDRRP